MNREDTLSVEGWLSTPHRHSLFSTGDVPVPKPTGDIETKLHSWAILRLRVTVVPGSTRPGALQAHLELWPPSPLGAG